MIDIDTFERLMEQAVCELPEEFFKELSGGVLLSPETMQSDADPGLIDLGQYIHSSAGSQIVLYYGSFMQAYGALSLSEEEWKEKIRHTVRHEFRHHLERQAKVDDLIREDEAYIRMYKESHGKA